MIPSLTPRRLASLTALLALLPWAACTPADPSSTADPPTGGLEDLFDTGHDDTGADNNSPANNSPANNNPANNNPDAPDATPDAPGGTPLRVATWNVERLFDTTCDTGSCGFQQYEALPSESFYNGRIDQIATAIEALDVDIVLLQEIEKTASVEDLAARLGPDYTIAVLAEGGYAASLDTAVIARGDLLDVTEHNPRLQRPSGGTTTFARKLLEVHLDLHGTRVIVFSAHFKAKSDDDPERRLVEATAAHGLVTDAADDHPDALILFGGDLNDTPGSEPINALEADQRLLRVAADRPEDDVWTYVYRNTPQAIDHLFIAQDARGGAYLPGSAQAVRDGASYGGSDHAALVATFIIP